MSADALLLSFGAMKRSAIIPDATPEFRYVLSREWNSELPRVCWIMLNPSTADHERDDPTICACIDFAERWECGAIDVVNLYAFRTSSPAMLRREAKHRDVVGIANDGHILRVATNARLVVAAWGRNGTATIGGKRRDEYVQRLLSTNRVRLHVLKVLPENVPGHPLARGNHRISRATKPTLFEISMSAERRSQERAVVPPRGQPKSTSWAMGKQSVP